MFLRETALRCSAVVLKPSEYSPLTTMFAARLCDEVGFPPGVVNFISGTGFAAGSPLSQSADIDMVSFTGSVPTGSAIMGEAAKNIVKPLLELGGKSPSVVFEDVDMDSALPWVMSGFLSNTGQVCIAQTRLLIHESRKAELLERLSAELKQVGFATDPLSVDAARMEVERHRPLGPIVNQSQFEKVLGFIEDAKAEGARLVSGGGRPASVSTGYFVEPTVFEVEPHHAIWRDEVFGPVLGVKSFSTEAEAIELANDSNYGLAANVFSQDEDRAERVASRLRAGKVFINQSTFNFPGISQHGYKQSGLGTEGGLEGLLEYMEIKSIAKNKGTNRPANFMREITTVDAVAASARL